MQLCIKIFMLLLLDKSSETPQRVQILRGPDGKIQVRGLMPGQQLVQMPDGKLHVLSTNQVQSPSTPGGGSTTPKAGASPTKATVKPAPTTPGNKTQTVSTVMIPLPLV